MCEPGAASGMEPPRLDSDLGDGVSAAPTIRAAPPIGDSSSGELRQNHPVGAGVSATPSPGAGPDWDKMRQSTIFQD